VTDIRSEIFQKIQAESYADQPFPDLLSSLELNPTRVQLASQRYTSVKDYLENQLRGVEVKQVGSFRKKLKIRPEDHSDCLDLDAIVCLGDITGYAKVPGQGIQPIDAVNYVLKVLKDNSIYKVMRPKVDVPTITLDYHDNFSIELIPCFREKSGAYPSLAPLVTLSVMMKASGNPPIMILKRNTYQI
jgi:hypothetical protein